nr:peripheral myelin protein 22-like isoform X1 [Pogona vitticeps]
MAHSFILRFFLTLWIVPPLLVASCRFRETTSSLVLGGYITSASHFQSPRAFLLLDVKICSCGAVWSDPTMNVLQICSVICSFVSLLLFLISLCSNYWVVNSTVHAGLWRYCVLNACSLFGMKLGAAGHAVRAFMLLGMIAGAVSFFGLCSSFFKSKVSSMSLIKTSANASILAALCVMIAMAIFTGASSAPGFVYGWSFIFGWASFPLFLITGVVTNLSRSRS